MQMIPKADLHNHAVFSCDREYLIKKGIKQCIIDFNPKQIQHGISIIQDKKVMKLAKERNIIFNVCPTSNLFLSKIHFLANLQISKINLCKTFQNHMTGNLNPYTEKKTTLLN